MDFLHGCIALLSFVILILTALTAWLYVQQTRIMQAVSALTSAITAPPPTFFEAAKEFPVEEHYIPAEPPVEKQEEEVDDRVSVHEEDDDVSESEHSEEDKLGPADESDDLGGKTVAQLKDMLTAKGIPFNKTDKKPVLLNLLKVAS